MSLEQSPVGGVGDARNRGADGSAEDSGTEGAVEVQQMIQSAAGSI